MVYQNATVVHELAIASFGDPRILILDEATSTLDGASESVVQQAPARLMVGRTAIFTFAAR